MTRWHMSILALAIACPVGAAAQQYTDEELGALFSSQVEDFGKLAAGEQPFGLTRQLVPLDAGNVDDPVVGTIADGSPTLTGTPGTVVGTGLTPASPDAGVNTGAGTRLVAADPATAPPQIEYGQFDPAKQVNIRVVFALDSAALSEDQKPKLAQLCRVMDKSPVNVFRIIGHTDASGPDAYNERLSLLRAKEVKRYFVSECGLPDSRLEAVGLGERFLYNDGDPSSGENRRVEFQALS